jgi:hypothetical protein
MSQEYATQIALPLILSFALLGLATCGLLFLGLRTGSTHLAQEIFRRSRLISKTSDLQWPLWVLIISVAFLAANQLLVRGIAVGTWDADGQFYPYYVLVADHARAARFVTWDPWSNGGLPMLGDPQLGAFSPVNTLLGWLTGGTSAGFILYWLLLWWLGGLGMLMLGRHLGAPPWGAGVVAMGFLFSGVYTGNAEHTSWISAFSFLPLTLWRLDLALGSRRLQPAAEAGALWGLSALAGYPGIVLITGCFAALWVLGRWIVGWSGGPADWPDTGASAWKPAGHFGLGLALRCLVIMGLVGAVILFPTYFGFFFEAAGTNSRVGALSRQIALSNSLEPGAVATLASPYLTALKVAPQFMLPGIRRQELWPGTDPSMVSVYAGSVIPTLALFSLISRPRDPWRWWIAALGILSLACAMGETLPFRGWLYDWFYPARFFRHAAIFRLYFVFAISVLAVLATRDLAAELRSPAQRARPHFLVAALAMTFVAVVAFLPFVHPEWKAGMPRSAVLLGQLQFGWIWLGICVVAALAWALPTGSRSWSVPVLLAALAMSDTLLTSVISIPTVLRVGEPAERWRRLDQQHRSSLDLTQNGLRRASSSCEPDLPSVRCRRNDQLITKIPVFNSYSTEKNVFHLAMIHDAVLQGMATGPDRVWFSRETAQVPPTEALLSVFRTRAATLGAPPLVIHSPKDLLGGLGRASSAKGTGPEPAEIARLPAAERLTARVVSYGPEELVLDVRTPAAGWLLVTDRWARSWQAEVNGRSATVYGGNFIFRAVAVAVGQNRVRFTYRPLGYPWLLGLSWTTLALVGVSRLQGARLRRK